MNSTLVIIPAFNEEKSIGRIVRAIKDEFPHFDVVVINDGSTDLTKSVASDSGATVLSHAYNLGYGVTLQTGYKYFQRHPEYKYLVQMDGDGQHNYRDIQRLLYPLLEKKAEIVIGSRFLQKKSSFRLPIVRYFGILFFRFLINFLTGAKIKDITSGFQAFDRNVVQTYLSDEFPYYYPDVNVLLLHFKAGFSIEEIPSAMQENKEGRSMHKGWGRQIYYVAAMVLSILIILLQNIRRTHAP